MKPTTFIEQNCTITHEGKTYTAGGAVVTPNEVIAYVGKSLGDGMGCDKFGPTSRRELTDWHGNKLGTCSLSSSWHVGRYYTKLYQIYAFVNGKQYTGRGQGEGMMCRLKLCKQPKGEIT